MPHIYEGHHGDLYAANHYNDDTYCEECGDSDMYIGFAANRAQAWKLLSPITDVHSKGDGWNYEYVQEFLAKTFPDERNICDIECEGD